MKADETLLGALVEGLGHHEETVPVYSVADPGIDEIEERAFSFAQRFGSMHGLGKTRHERRRGSSRTAFRLQENIRAGAYHASGAISLSAGLGPLEAIVAADAEQVDEDALRRQANEALKRLEVQNLANIGEDLRFERLWRLKAAGVTEQGEHSPTALTRVVGAYRRHIGQLPVFGRASVFVEIAAEGKPAAAGIDWRPVMDGPIDETEVLSPEEGALRALAELQRFNPDRDVTHEDYTPDLFALGYFSLAKRSPQAVMQPTYVAMLRPTGPLPSTGRLIVVPAAPNAHEPISRPRAVPLAEPRPRPQRS